MTITVKATTIKVKAPGPPGPPGTANASNVGFDDASQGPPLGVDTVQQAIDALKKSEHVFVVDPTIGASSGNVFVTLAASYAAINALNPSGQVEIQFLGDTQTIPSGTYHATIRGPLMFSGSSPKLFGTQLTLADGVHFTGTYPIDFDRLTTINAGTGAPVIDVTDGAVFRFRGTSVQQTTGTAPLIRASGGAKVVVQLWDQTGTFSGLCFDSAGTGSRMTIIPYDYADVFPNTLGSDGVGVTEVQWVSPAADVQFAQSAMPGGVLVVGSTVNRQAYAKRIDYEDTAPLLGADTVQEALNALKTNTINSYVYRQGETSPGGVIFADWALLHAAVSAGVGQRTIEIDCSVTYPSTVPAGTWDFSSHNDVTIVGTPSATQNNARLRFLDGAKIHGVRSFDRCDVEQYSTTPVRTTLGGKQDQIIFSHAAMTLGPGAAPFIDVTGSGSFCLVQIYDYGLSASDHVGPLVRAATGGFLVVMVEGIGYVDADTIARDSGSGLSVQINSSGVTVSTSHAGVPGGVITPVVHSAAANVKYNDSVSPALGSVTTQGAIDAVKPWRVFTVTDVYINAAAGSDLSDGLTSGTAWKTNARLRSAIGLYGRVQPSGNTLTVHYIGASVPPQSDPFHLQAIFDANAVMIRDFSAITGQTIHTGSFSAVRLHSHAAPGTAPGLTDASIPNWAPYVGKRLRITSGASSGAVCGILRAETATRAETQVPAIYNGFGSSVAYPSASDTYVVEDLPVTWEGVIDIKVDNGDNFNAAYVVHGATIGSDGFYGSSFTTAMDGGLQYYRACVFTQSESRAGPSTTREYAGCVFQNQFYNTVPGQCLLKGCGIIGVCAAANGGIVSFHSIDTICEGGGVVAFTGGKLVIEAVGSFNAAVSFLNPSGDAFASAEVPGAGSTGTICQIAPGGAMYGSGSAGVGWRIGRGCTDYAQVAPVVTGTGGDFAGQAVATANPFSGTSYAAAIACTWANMLSAAAFNGQAHWPSTNSHLLTVPGS